MHDVLSDICQVVLTQWISDAPHYIVYRDVKAHVCHSSRGDMGQPRGSFVSEKMRALRWQ